MYSGIYNVLHFISLPLVVFPLHSPFSILKYLARSSLCFAYFPLSLMIKMLIMHFVFFFLLLLALWCWLRLITLA